LRQKFRERCSFSLQLAKKQMLLYRLEVQVI